MKKEKQMSFPELAEWAIERTLKAGADECRVRLYKSRFVEVNYREHKPDTLKEASTRNLGIEVFANKRYVSQSTPDFRLESLENFIKELVESAAIMEEDPFRMLPQPEMYAGRPTTDLELADPAYEQLTADERHSVSQKVENACFEKGGEKVLSVEAGTYDEKWESYTRTSNGFEGASMGTTFALGAGVSAQDEGDRRPNGYSSAYAPHRSDLPTPEKIGEEAAFRTLDQFGAKKMPSATLPVIVENRVVEWILGFLLNPLYGRNIQQQRSCLADKKGQQIGSKLFTVIDDPLIPRAPGSRLFDSDGFPAKKRNIFTEGVLNDFFIDWYYSRKLEREPTSGSISNIIIPPGERSVEDIIKEYPRCLFITNFIGGNSNSTTGDFSIGIFGKLYEKGKFKQNVAEMNIADNHLTFWSKLVEVANDPWIYSNVRVPALVFNDVVVAGI